MTNQSKERINCTDVHMEGNGTAFDYSRSTRAKTLDQKRFVIPACILIFLLDIACFIFLLAGGYEFSVALFPLLFAVCDLVFTIVASRISFKFKYAKWHIFLYIFALLVLVLVTFGVWMWSTAVVMTYLAASLFLTFHVALLVLCLINVRVACEHSRRRTITNGVILGVMLLVSLVGIIFCYTRGFFGQANGNSFEEKTVIYTYDKASDGYVATSFLTGKGTRVTIPENFNGKPVTFIDTGLLAANDLKSLSVTGTATQFRYSNATYTATPNIDILLNKETYDAQRRQFIQVAQLFNDNGLYALANRFVPAKLEAGEHMIVFAYDFATLGRDLANTCVLSHTTDKSSMAINDLTALGDCFKYYSTAATETDLLCYSEFGTGYYVSSIKNDAGMNFVGSPLTEAVVRANVTFEKVLHVEFGSSNDTHVLGTTDNFITTSVRYQNKDYDRYTTSAAALLGEMKARQGFSYAYSVVIKEGGHVVYTANHTVADTIALLDAKRVAPGSSRLDVTLNPIWVVNAPAVSVGAQSITYGENIDFNVTASGDCIKLYYRLYKDDIAVGDLQEENPAFHLTGYVPADSGNYSVGVFATDSEKTNLTSVESISRFVISVAKKPLSAFSWTTPDGETYDGTEKNVRCDHDTENEPLVGSDVLTYTNSHPTIKAAGTYSARITLTGDAAEKYVLTGTSFTKTFEYKRRVTSVLDQDSLSFIYNGGVQRPTVTDLDNLVSGEKSTVIASLQYAGATANAGAQNVTISLPASSNYMFETNPVISYTIEQKEVTFSAWSTSPLTYNGMEQSPQVGTLDGIVSTDSETIIRNGLIYDGKETNAGSGYSVTVAFPANSNYKFSTATALTTSFSIAQKPLSVGSWNAQSLNLVYNGNEQRPFVSILDGVLPAEDTFIKNGLVYTGAETDAGDYTITVSLPAGSNYVFEETQSSPYTIQKKNLTIAWDAVTYTYDGNNHRPSVNKLTGVVTEKDDHDTILAMLSYTNAGGLTDNVGNRNAGSNYSVTAALSHTNYTLAGSLTTSYVIKPAVITVSRWDKASFTYNGGVQTPVVSELNGVVANDDANAIIGTLTYTEATSVVGQYTDAANYTITAYLPASSNYTFNTTQKSDFVIHQRPISVALWENTLLTYNGIPQAATVATFSADLIPADEDTVRSELIYGVKQTNAGEDYTITVTLASGSNYVFESAQSTSYTIQKATISVNTWNTTQFIYNGVDQHPRAASLTGALVAGQESSVLSSLTYTGAARNASSSNYTVTAALPENSNYKFSSTQSTSFTISKKIVTLSAANWQNGDLIYNGEDQFPGINFPASAVQTGDNASDIIATLTYVVGGTNTPGTFTNVGNNYSVTVSMDHTNYDLAGTVTRPYIILPKTVVVSAWDTDTFAYTYDGSAHMPRVTTLSGLVTGDANDEIVALINYSMEAPINAGSYTVTISFPSTANYKFASTVSKAFSIAKKTLTDATWSSESFVYDGNPHRPSITSVDGLVGTDVLSVILAELEYTDEGKVNAGSNHLASAQFKSSSNYKLSSSASSTYYSIAQKSITITGWTTGTLTFNGAVQHPDVAAVSGVISGDNSLDVMNAITYNLTTDCQNAGEHSVTANLIGGNYILSGNCTRTFSIEKKTVALTWKDNTAGSHPKTLDLTGKEYASDISVTYSYSTMSNEPVDGIPTEAGTYTVTANIAFTTAYENYLFSNTQTTVTITVEEDV